MGKVYKTFISSHLKEVLPDVEEMRIDVDVDDSGNEVMGKIRFYSDGKLIDVKLHQSAMTFSLSSKKSKKSKRCGKSFTRNF